MTTEAERQAAERVDKAFRMNTALDAKLRQAPAVPKAPRVPKAPKAEP